ncbi:DUF2806 domain-containing protein [Chryseobacterium lathyri]|uniref:DUF2806 domain-containing protein n=1 Tax=Chryseobacterium lathyri TaxID=395933 RepID=A0ABT9SQZ7_9FLAO|nr:DUF2806 domain-containing protein [Chryseobacterium lathyri]MDP9961862.1 hypothetical protein [Chryseobacterium lathyri]
MSEDENPLTTMTNTLETVITGIPAPIRKNVIKAFGQLCTATVDIPVAWLEGKAEVIRATHKARVNIINTTGEITATKIDVPEIYSQIAAEKFASKIIREQINLDKIVSKTAGELSNYTEDNNTNKIDEIISDEWLNEFEEVAKLKTNEDMRILFSKILSNEIKKPGTFSVKTIKTVSQLDPNTARFFNTLCSLTCFVKSDDVIVVAMVPNVNNLPHNNRHLVDYGLNHHAMTILQEYGLVRATTSSYQIGLLINSSTPVNFGNRTYYLRSNNEPNHYELTKLDGFLLTQSGLELLSVLTIDNNDLFIASVNEWLSKKNIQFFE